MLTFEHDKETGVPKLRIDNPFAAAWIGQHRRLTPALERVKKGCDWRLYVQPAPQLPPRAGKSPTSLLIESRLRAWLLQRYRRRLNDLGFAELCAIAEHEARRVARA